MRNKNATSVLCGHPMSNSLKALKCNGDIISIIVEHILGFHNLALNAVNIMYSNTWRLLAVVQLAAVCLTLAAAASTDAVDVAAVTRRTTDSTPTKNPNDAFAGWPGSEPVLRRQALV